MNPAGGGSRKGPRPAPESLGRRSPLYHPYLLVLVALLVVMLQVSSWLKSGTPRLVVGFLSAQPTEALWVSRHSSLTAVQAPLSEGVGSTFLVDLNRDAVAVELPGTVVDCATIVAAPNDPSVGLLAVTAGFCREFTVTRDSSGTPTSLEPGRAWALDDIDMHVGAVSSTPAGIELAALAGSGSVVVHSRLSTSKWISNAVHECPSGRVARFVAMTVGASRRLWWIETDADGSGAKMHSSIHAGTSWSTLGIGVDLSRFSDIAGIAVRETAGGDVIGVLGREDGQSAIAVTVVRTGESGSPEVIASIRQPLADRKWSAVAMDAGIGAVAVRVAAAAPDAIFAMTVKRHNGTWILTSQNAVDTSFAARGAAERIRDAFIGLAVLALIIAGFEAFRRPVASEPPRTRPPASHWRRLGAWAIDTLIVTAIAVAASGENPANAVTATMQESETARVAAFARLLGWFEASQWLQCLTWYVLMTVGLATLECRFGRTLGKAVFGLRVVGDENSTAPGLWRFIGRRLLVLVDLLYLTCVFALLNPRHQRLGDIAARTVVVSDTPAAPESGKEQEAQS